MHGAIETVWHELTALLLGFLLCFPFIVCPQRNSREKANPAHHCNPKLESPAGSQQAAPGLFGGQPEASQSSSFPPQTGTFPSRKTSVGLRACSSQDDLHVRGIFPKAEALGLGVSSAETWGWWFENGQSKVCQPGILPPSLSSSLLLCSRLASSGRHHSFPHEFSIFQLLK